MKALDIGVGDEVITAPNSFIASAWTIANTGADVRFADAGWDMNIDPAKIEDAITSKTKAIMPVHLTGKIADMDAILEIAQAWYTGIKAGATQMVKSGSFVMQLDLVFIL